MRKALLILLLLPLSAGIFAQKALKPIRKLIKAKNGVEALAQIAKLEADTTFEATTELYVLAINANNVRNNAENEKMYLKQPYDTLAFFDSNYGIFRYAMKADSMAKAQQEDFSFPRDIERMFVNYYSNLGAGGRFFYAKKDYKNAAKYFSMSLDAVNAGFWNKQQWKYDQKRYSMSAYLCMKSYFLLNDWKSVSKYKEAAMSNGGDQRMISLEYLALASYEMGDTTAYVSYLNQGVNEYPKHPFFFSYLSDYHRQQGDYKAALALADSLLKVDSTNVYFLSGRALALMDLEHYDESIAVSQEVLQADSALADAYFNIGACYCNLALNLKLPSNINSSNYRKVSSQIKNYYKKALPYLEKYRAMMPSDSKRWAPLLYRVYLMLNMGDKFEEIDKIMSNLD